MGNNNGNSGREMSQSFNYSDYSWLILSYQLILLTLFTLMKSLFLLGSLLALAYCHSSHTPGSDIDSHTLLHKLDSVVQPVLLPAYAVCRM